MSSKRKANPNQPELPIEEPPDNTPGVVNAAPAPKGGNGEAPKPRPAKGGNGATRARVSPYGDRGIPVILDDRSRRAPNHPSDADRCHAGHQDINSQKMIKSRSPQQVRQLHKQCRHCELKRRCSFLLLLTICRRSYLHILVFDLGF